MSISKVNSDSKERERGEKKLLQSMKMTRQKKKAFFIFFCEIIERIKGKEKFNR